MHGIVLLTVTSMMLIIIRGVAGTGKTTLAKQFKTPHHYEADMFMEATGGWEGRKLPMAHAWCTERVADALATKAEVVVVSNTFVKREHMEQLAKVISALESKKGVISVERS